MNQSLCHGQGTDKLSYVREKSTCDGVQVLFLTAVEDTGFEPVTPCL